MARSPGSVWASPAGNPVTPGAATGAEIPDPDPGDRVHPVRLIAGVYGLAGNAASLSSGEVYKHASKLFDITTGNNALSGTARASCGNDYLCAAKKGYDAPTGLGTPNGTGAF